MPTAVRRARADVCDGNAAATAIDLLWLNQQSRRFRVSALPRPRITGYRTFYRYRYSADWSGLATIIDRRLTGKRLFNASTYPQGKNRHVGLCGSVKVRFRLRWKAPSPPFRRIWSARLSAQPLSGWAQRNGSRSPLFGHGRRVTNLGVYTWRDRAAVITALMLMVFLRLMMFRKGKLLIDTVRRKIQMTLLRRCATGLRRNNWMRSFLLTAEQTAASGGSPPDRAMCRLAVSAQYPGDLAPLRGGREARAQGYQLHLLTRRTAPLHHRQSNHCR